MVSGNMRGDNEDCIKLRKLAAQYNEVTKLANNAITKWMYAETQLDKAIIKYRIKDTLSWKKQVLNLIATQPGYDELHTDFMGGKKDEKTTNNVLKAIENETNIIKKIFEVTPE
jgi:hypothetical protein